VGLKALINKGSDDYSSQTNGRTLPATSFEYSESIAATAIAMAALNDEQKAARLADLRRDPAIARFWALVWPEATNPTSKDSS